MEKYEKFLAYFAGAFIFFSLIVKIWLIYNLPIGFDEGGYGLVSSGLLDGLDIFDHKPPFLHYLLASWMYLFGGTIVSVRFLALLLDFALAMTIFFVAKNYVGKNKAIMGSALYFALSFVEGIYLSTEIPSVIFGLLGVFMYLKALNGNRMNYFLSGVLIAISIWFKQPAVLFFIAILVHQGLLVYRNKLKFRECLNNVLLNLLGILIVSVPLLSYFLYKQGSLFIYKIITFNLLFKGSTSRIFSIGKAIYLLASVIGILFVFMANNKTKHKTEYSVFKIAVMIWLVFFLLSQEVFYAHLFGLIPFLIILTLMSSENYTKSEMKMFYAVIIVAVLIPVMTNLNSIAREYKSGDLESQGKVIEYLKQNIPDEANVFSDNSAYQFAMGKKSLYKITALAPSFASVFDLTDFCDFSDNLDYLVLTHREKYLPEETLNCTLNKFTLMEKFDNVGESFVEVWKKNENN